MPTYRPAGLSTSSIVSAFATTRSLPDSAKDKWQLYQITEDFSEANDLAGQDPKRLADLQLVFDEQAKANRVYPGGGFNASIRSRRRSST